MRQSLKLFVCALLLMSPATHAHTPGEMERGAPAEKKNGFDLSKIDLSVIAELERAWWISRNGTSDKEGLVLILRAPDGSYKAQLHGQTNEHKKVTFTWSSSIIAIAHTHPNNVRPEPSDIDRQVADKFGVPVFTITGKGMYMYHPATKKTSLVHRGIDWLEPSKWAGRAG